MLITIGVMTTLGLVLGLILGFADKIFAVEENPLVKEVEEMLPGTHCGQCGFTGCAGAADAIVGGEASVTCCPPGGKALAQELATKLGVDVNLDDVQDAELVAEIDASLCTGCCRCYRACPTDAIIGANKQIHAVFSEACTGCKKCFDSCPEDCISMKQPELTLEKWHWPKPEVA